MVIGLLSAERREAFLTHLHGATPSRYLVGWLERATGERIGKTTINDYRRAVAEL